jgi:transcriptional regulator with XRE-family HTH domain
MGNADGYRIVGTMEKRIKQARLEAGLSQAALSRRMYVTQPTVSDWESGRKAPHVKNLIRLALLLGVDFEWLSTGRGEMRPPPAIAREAGWAIPEDERDLLAGYASLKPPQREALLVFLKSLTV